MRSFNPISLSTLPLPQLKEPFHHVKRVISPHNASYLSGVWISDAVCSSVMFARFAPLISWLWTNHKLSHSPIHNLGIRWNSRWSCRRRFLAELLTTGLTVTLETGAVLGSFSFFNCIPSWVSLGSRKVIGIVSSVLLTTGGTKVEIRGRNADDCWTWWGRSHPGSSRDSYRQLVYCYLSIWFNFLKHVSDSWVLDVFPFGHLSSKCYIYYR